TPGQVITIKLVAGVGGSLGFNIGAVDDGAPRGTVVSFWTNPGLGTELSPGYIENADPEPGLSGALISYWAFVTTAAPVPAGADLIRFVYTVPSVVTAPITIATLPAGAAFRSPADGAVWVVEASAVGRGLDIIEIGSVTLIPEPMTIGLLGLGGLFLRRRLA
ncbi:MAG TPA: PEP-CTERM sorting domain-containing protein, partial [Sedimentisphaerales bacterium]|nr:PEP-CTERM sorting domain-containing protein [Sedimentisphaerales bacterium]